MYDYNYIQAYQEYNAVKLHFSKSKFDFFKYNGKVKAPKNKLKIRDEYIFKKLANRYERNLLIYYFAKSFYYNDKFYIQSVPLEQMYSDIAKIEKVRSSLEYTFKQELTEMLDKYNLSNSKNYMEFKKLFTGDSELPIVLREHIAHSISAETICMVNILFCLTKSWDSNIGNDMMYMNIGPRLKKFTDFFSFTLDFDRKKCLTYLDTMIN